MKLPRDLTGKELIKALEQMGYHVTRQSGSHVRLSYQTVGEHHVTVPLHNPFRIGTLAAILADVAAYHKLTRERLVSNLFEKS